MGEPLLIDTAQAAELTGLPEWKIWKLCRENRIPHKRLGRKGLYFSPEALRHWAQVDESK